MRIRPRGGSRAGARESATPFPPADSRAARLPFIDDHPTLLTLLANALESKVLGTATHSQRVQRYAIDLADAIEPAVRSPSPDAMTSDRPYRAPHAPPGPAYGPARGGGTPGR